MRYAEGRILVADLLLRIASDVPPCPDFVHALELENDDAVRWRLARYRKCLIEPASEVFAPIIIDGLLRGWEKVIFVTGLVLDRDFSNDIRGGAAAACRPWIAPAPRAKPAARANCRSGEEAIFVLT